MHEKEPFKGSKADLFAFGVTVFAMRCAKFPWNLANAKNDFNFKHFLNNNLEKFW